MLRQFRRNRAFHAVIVGLLGLGIGAVTLVFSLVNELLLKPLPVRDPNNLYVLERMNPRNLRPDTSFNERHLREIMLRSPLVTAAIAEQPIDPRSLVPLRQEGGTRLLMTQIVSPTYFRELGLRAAVGRLLDETDAQPAATLPVVLSYQFWESQYSGDRSAIGRKLRLKDADFVIVG